MVESLPDIDDLGLDDLKKLVVELFERISVLREENAALRAEIARLKGLKGRPQLKPSGMEEASKRKQVKARRKQRRRGSKRTRLAEAAEAVVLRVTAPPGSRHKGYEDYFVQNLELRPRVIRYRRERWVTPEGKSIVAPLPDGVVGHFGPELRRFVLAQYHQMQATIPRLVRQLAELGIAISKRQVVRLLSAGQQGFLAESTAVLRSGLEGARWIWVDDTGARHRGRNGVCTAVGNDRFAWFAGTFSKSRLNFLGLLRAGYGDHLINEAALAYMRRRNLAGPLIARLAGHETKWFADEAAWQRHLDDLGISALAVSPDPVQIATEGALWGSVMGHGLLRDAVILSDDAGQFNVGHHALCWVHAERLVYKLEGFSDWKRQARDRVRKRIWRLYADLKAYCRDPARSRKAALRRRFELIFKTCTGFATLDRQLARLHANKAELLVALERPEVPLNTNGVENDIRCQVTRRKISGGTRSQAGRDCRDAFLGLMKTCDKQRISFWHYLGDRLKVPGAPTVPYLPDLVRQIPAPP
jgi:hypothetical protein